MKIAKLMTRVGESRRLKELNQVVSSTKALGAFRNARPLLEAYLLTGAPAEIYREAINDALGRLKDARDVLHAFEEPTETDTDTLKEILQLGRDLHGVLNDRLLNLELE